MKYPDIKKDNPILMELRLKGEIFINKNIHKFKQQLLRNIKMEK